MFFIELMKMVFQCISTKNSRQEEIQVKREQEAMTMVVGHKYKVDAGCVHDWRESVDSQFSNETHTQVKCTKCGIIGEMTTATREVFFPAT